MIVLSVFWHMCVYVCMLCISLGHCMYVSGYSYLVCTYIPMEQTLHGLLTLGAEIKSDIDV